MTTFRSPAPPRHRKPRHVRPPRHRSESPRASARGRRRAARRSRRGGGRGGSARFRRGVSALLAAYVARVALRLLGSDGEVDDLVQDVFLEAHRGLSSLREAGALGGWLARICVRRATRRLRRRRWLSLLSLDTVAERELPFDVSASPEAAGGGGALVHGRLDRLPANERVVWLLRHVEGESLDEMVLLCACSKSTVQRRLRSAEARLLVEVRS